jgi:Zn-dependent protease
VIVFPDSRFYTYPDSTTIPPLTHTLASGEAVAAGAPMQTCSTRNLPLSWLIPDELAPLAAVASGIGVVAIVNAMGSQWSNFFQKIWALLQKFIMKLLAPFISRKEVEKRGLRPDQGGSPFLFTLSRRELSVIAISALIFSVAFLLKDRLAIQVITILVFILMGGMATVAHELSHRYFARRWHGESEFQFWGLGTAMMLVTAGLFGTVFAKPSRTLTAATERLTKEQGVIVAFAGPIANIVFALASLLIIPFGGILTLIGQAGLSMNLLAAVFEMVPLALLDGKKLYAYSKFLWAAAFFPLMILYIAIYMV